MSCEPSVGDLIPHVDMVVSKKKGHRPFVGRNMRLQRLSKVLFKSFSSPNFCLKTELFKLRDVRKPRFDCKRILGLRTKHFENLWFRALFMEQKILCLNLTLVTLCCIWARHFIAVYPVYSRNALCRQYQ